MSFIRLHEPQGREEFRQWTMQQDILGFDKEIIEKDKPG